MPPASEDPKKQPISASAAVSRPDEGTALVLGYRGISEGIARQLEAAGYRTSLLDPATQALPSLANPHRIDRLRQILGEAAAREPREGVRLLHPGVATWAERTEVASIGQEFGYTTLTPPGRSLVAIANKLNILLHAEKLGIPNLLISPDPVHSVREIEALSRDAQPSGRFPLILKDVHGGGSRGRQTFRDADDLAARLPLWIEQVRRNFGEVILFAERHLEAARSITLPFAAFDDGRIEFFPSLDGSLQSGQRRVIEFCPAPALDEPLKHRLQTWTSELVRSVGFTGVGAGEFLVDGRRAFLIDVAGSLTVSFPLWERVAGTRAVDWQLATLLGRPVPDRNPRKSWSVGIGLRLFAEDSLLHLPQPGAIREVSGKREWRFPTSEAEFLPGYEAGDEVVPTDSGLLGAVLIGGPDRKLALTVARGVLEEIWIAGSLQTNERFLGELLEHPWVREGVFHAGFVEEEFVPALRPPADMIRLFSTIIDQDPRIVPENGPRPRWAVGDGVVAPGGATPHWTAGPERWETAGLPGISGALELSDGRRARVCAFPVREGRWIVRIGAWCYQVRRIAAATPASVPPSASPETKLPKVRALVSGRVHSVLFREGSEVPAREPLVVIESLGMLVPHALPLAARVARWRFTAESPVRAGDELAEVEIFRTPPTS